MSEEIKNTTGMVAGETQSAPTKKKKINRLTAEELTNKISDLEKNNLTSSTYYKHLIIRKNSIRL